jgi:hypothetical protein
MTQTMTETANKDTPLFSKYYDLLLWLAPRVADFPRAQRYLLGRELIDTAFDGYKLLVEARKTPAGTRDAVLRQADALLESLRAAWRLASDLRCISPKQYEHGAGLIGEVGRLLGAWRKAAG